MEKLRILEGRSGTVWPTVLKVAANSRMSGRRVALYVPEQMTLQTERDLITHLRLKGLLDIEVISPRKLRLMVRESTGGSERRMLDEAGQMMAVHRAMTEQAEELAGRNRLTEYLMPPDCALAHLPAVNIHPGMAGKVMNGAKLPVPPELENLPENQPVRIYLSSRFWGIAQRQGEELRWKVLIAPEEGPEEGITCE